MSSDLTFSPSPSSLTIPAYQNTSKSRLQALYSDISRQKHSNPTAYSSNVEWWRNTLESLVSTGWQGDTTARNPTIAVSSGEEHPELNKLILSAGRGLVDKLRYQGVGKPLGLGAVIAELRSTKALIPLSQFLNSPQSVYDPGWLPYRVASFVLGKPLWWALEQLEIVQSEDKLNESEMWKRVSGDYVVLALVERTADDILRRREAKGAMGATDALFTLESFRKEFASAVKGGILSETDVKVLVRYLERDRKIVVVDKDMVKFIEPGQPLGITVVDRGILELKSAVQNLHAQVVTIQSRIDDCSAKISSALHQKRQPTALSYLRSKKQLEDLLKKRLGSLATLESTLIRVESAAGDVEIMKSYELSTGTLRNILAHPSLQRDKIEDTMEAMASASADARDVDDAIRMGGDMAASEAGIDESELEEELRALVKETEREGEELKTQTRLEDQAMQVPSNAPGPQQPLSGARQDNEHERVVPGVIVAS